MRGMDRETGKALEGRAHLGQSLRVLLSTPIGTRVMLPEYGSDLVNLIDVGLTDSSRLRIYKATVDSISRWEPRLEVTRVRVSSNDAQGEMEILIEGFHEGAPIVVQGIQIGRQL